MNLKQNIKLTVWFMKIHPPIRVNDDFECMNIQVDDPQRKTLIETKPLGIRYNIPKDPCLSNMKIEKQGTDEHFGGDCVEKFVIEMLQRRVT